MSVEPSEPQRMNNESISQQIDALEACLRAVLAWHEQPMSSNSLRARINGSLGFWTEDDLLEAADSLGYEVEINEHDSALSSLPELPAICLTHEVGALALLSVNDEGLLLVVDPNRSDKPEWTSKQDLFGRLGFEVVELLLQRLEEELFAQPRLAGKDAVPLSPPLHLSCGGGRCCGGHVAHRICYGRRR